MKSKTKNIIKIALPRLLYYKPFKVDLRGFYFTVSVRNAYILAIYFWSVKPIKNNTMGKFVITKRVNGEYQFNLKAGNGEIILTSEGYNQKASCQKGITSVKNNSQDDSKYDRRVAKMIKITSY